MKTKKMPMRRCAGCMESKPKNELIRIASYEGEVSFDPTGRARGRGVYLCPSADCMKKAVKKHALQRSLKVQITDEQMERILKEIEEYTEDRHGGQ